MYTETKLSPSIGSKIDNIDVRRLDEDGLKTVKDAFLRRGMLVFPGQHLQGAEVAEWGRRFGDLWTSRILKGLPEAPEVLELTNTGKENTQTEYWHYDSTYTARPPAITILSALTIPMCGGDTMWCDQYAVLDALSPAMQKMLRGLNAVHYDKQRHRKLADRLTTDEQSIHPVIRTHPETKRLALFISSQAEHFEGMSREESSPLLQYLLGLLGQPHMSYRHRWQVGDLLMWDNRCTTHYAVHDYGQSQRVMHRVTVAGDVPA
jgi:taurine dioxygenase